MKFLSGSIQSHGQKGKNCKIFTKNLQSTQTDNFKNTRTSTARHPKHLDYTVQQKPSFFNRIKSHPAKTHRDMVRSAIPPEIHSPENQFDSKVKHFQSNMSLNELFQSQSEKTIKPKVGEKQKSRNKSSKKSKINKTKKFSKCDFKETVDSRKCSVSSSKLDKIFKRTVAVLKIYELRELQWQKQKAKLMQELEELKQKNFSKGITTASSIYIHKSDYLY